MPIVFSEQKKRIIKRSLLGLACLSVITAAMSFQLPKEQIKGETIRKQPMVVSNWPDEIIPEPSEEPYIEPEVYVPAKAVTQPNPSPTPLVVSCGLNNNTVYVTMPKSECDTKQAQEVSSNPRLCHVYYSYFQYTRSYSGLSDSECANLQKEAGSVSPPANATFSIAPFASIEPYKPSQEYQDSLNKNMQEINKDWKPSPFVAPSPKCNPVGDGFNCF